MSLLTSLAGRFTQVALIGPTLVRLKRRAVRVAIGGVLIAIFGIAGFAYLLVALRNEVEPYLGPTWTPLAIGGGLIVFAGIAYLAFVRPRASDAGLAQAQAAAVREKIVRPARKLEGQVADRPLQSLAIAIALGFVAASALRLLRGRDRAPSPASADEAGAAAPPPRATPAERAAGMHEGVLRRTDRRRGANGREA